jgi:hypothetical protein
MSKITKSAKGEDCLVRIPGVCNHNPETTIFAHIGGGGMGIKSGDSEGAYCCSRCHDVLDGRVKSDYTRDEIELWHHQGAMRTRYMLTAKGLMILK